MIFRRAGDTDLNCSIIGLGTGRLASVSGGISRAAALRLIGQAQDLGINLIDTADSYAQGQCEKLIGIAIRENRSQFIITTKAGYTFSTLGGGLRLLKPLAKRVLKLLKGGRNIASNIRSNVSRQNFAPQSIRNSVTASLQRLQTDYIDIFLLHSPSFEAISSPELIGLLRALKSEGKVRYFGVSSPDPSVLEAALGIDGLSIVQTPISPAQMVDAALLKKMQEKNIGVVANQIFLSGKLIRGEAGGATIKNNLETIAASKNLTLQQLLTCYALCQPGVISILSGTTKADHLKQNVADALGAQNFSSDELQQFRSFRVNAG